MTGLLPLIRQENLGLLKKSVFRVFGAYLWTEHKRRVWKHDPQISGTVIERNAFFS